MARLLVINGPNLSLLGEREPEIYGHTTLEEAEGRLEERAKADGHELLFFQSDAEHELLKRIHKARDENIALIIFNPAAFTHTSVVLRDALLAVEIPFIEVHLSNVFSREDFRQHSFFSDIAIGTISGFTFEYSYAKNFPLLPTPHWTSSRINKIFF